MRRKKIFSNCHNFDDWDKNCNYDSAGNFVSFLVEKYGKEKLIKLIKRLEEFESKKGFKKNFLKVYKKDFGKVMEGWIKKS